MLVKLIRYFEKNGGPRSEVVSLAEEGPLGVQIQELGVPVISLGLRPSIRAPLILGALVSLFRKTDADCVHCWMYHANVLGGMAAVASGQKRVIWGLRQSNLNPGMQKLSTVAFARLGIPLSYCIPAAIACVSQSALLSHSRMGYCVNRMLVIPNGFDLVRFRPDEAARNSLRAELGLHKSATIIGYAARFDPMKNIGGFLEAIQRLAGVELNVVLCGEGMSLENRPLKAILEQANVRHRVFLLGRRQDMSRVTSGFDIACNASSFGEGFSNALGEAMCCGVPAVATDVGDARTIVGEAGFVVPPGNVPAFADAMQQLLSMPKATRQLMGMQARERMKERFELAAIAKQYVRLYADVLSGEFSRPSW